MYGEDSSGRKISLLNGDASAVSPKASTTTTNRTTSISPIHVPLHPANPTTVLPPLVFRTDPTHYYQARRSISPKSPSSTPPLVRQNSNSSQSDSHTSPMTPSYPQDPQDPQNKPTPYFTYPRPNAQMYPVMGSVQNPYQMPYQLQQRDMASSEMTNGAGAFNQQALLNLPPPLSYPNPEPPMIAPSPRDVQTPHLAQLSPTTTSSSTSQPEKPNLHSAGTQTSSTSPTEPKPAKKKFPCPHAARYNCSDTFTTSGHAARHGKKHTGEKSVVCPTCSKAFTRKDNMKQHERTHKPRADSTVLSINPHTGRQRDGRSRSPSIPPTASTESLSTETSGFDFGAHSQSQSDGADHIFSDAANRRRPGARISNSSRRSEEDGEGESPGLDALAAAAIMS
ncbi:MAG: hypothetical protein Q9201_002051 [Fulgogasparrea decipioides]